MDNTSKKIWAVMPNEHFLELTINRLLAEAVSRSDISVQGAPEQLKEKYGVSYIDPEVVATSEEPPKTEPYLNDDWGWLLGFSFVIPLFLCIILGVFIIGDIRSYSDIFLYGSLGLIIGSILGFLCLTVVKQRHFRNTKKQESKGGFVLWVTTHTKVQYQQVLDILGDKAQDASD